MPDFGIFRGFNDKLFGNKLYAGQLPTQLGKIGSESFGFTGLLDDYPNSAAAYSLRLLSKTYTGSAIRVRRSSDNLEQNIGFVNNVLDTASLLSHCGSGNGFVTTWFDQSGNARNATQTTAANQPQIVSNGSVLITNGKPSVQFDGSNDSFTLSSNISSSTSYTAIEVNRRTDTTTNSVGFATVSGQPYVNLFLSTILYFDTIRSGLGYFGIYNINSTNQQLLFSIDDKSSNLKTYLNQNLVIDNLNNVGSLTGTDFNNIGIRSGNTKDVKQELVFYPSDQSSNRTGISTNINTYYGIY